MSLVATRELAEATGFHVADLVACNPHKAHVLVDGEPAFCELTLGEVLALPDGREAMLTGQPPLPANLPPLSQFTAQYQGDPAQLQGIQDRINSAASLDVNGGTKAGILAAVNGQQPSESEIQSAFATAAVAVAVAAGASAAVAAAYLVPIAAVVFGGGYALGQLVQKVFGITNSTPEACSDTDPSHYAQSPGDPGWIPYSAYFPHWQPFSSGAFETWVRPIVVRTSELVANCKSLPGVPNIGQFAAALVANWNGSAPPGTPMRRITWYLDAGFVGSYDQEKAYEGDPVQELIRYLFLTYDSLGRATGTKPHPWSIEIADIAATQAHRIVEVRVGKTALRITGSGGAALPSSLPVGARMQVLVQYQSFDGWHGTVVPIAVSDPHVLSINEGTATGLANGVVTLTAKYGTGTATHALTVGTGAGLSTSAKVGVGAVAVGGIGTVAWLLLGRPVSVAAVKSALAHAWSRV